MVEQDRKDRLFKIFSILTHIDPTGKVTSGQKIFDFSELSYNEKGLQCPYFELTQTKTLKGRKYLMDFKLDEIKGSVTITSSSKVFSPLPTSSMGEFATRHILKLKGKDLAFRYASYVPQGEVLCNLEVQGKRIEQSGKAYHEQGWFTGEASQMGPGWTWFHFVSENINVFGKPGDFICLEKSGKRIVGGISYKNLTLTDKVYGSQYDKLLMGGNINFSSGKTSFVIHPHGKKTTALIYLPSFETDQLWGTVAQPSTMTLSVDGKEIREQGILIMETCNMQKNAVSQLDKTP
jgi:hypothetical protein